ncbi:hypothetical protein STEG23_035787, partial [Scotinomys teguina]
DPPSLIQVYGVIHWGLGALTNSHTIEDNEFPNPSIHDTDRLLQGLLSQCIIPWKDHMNAFDRDPIKSKSEVSPGMNSILCSKCKGEMFRLSKKFFQEVSKFSKIMKNLLELLKGLVLLNCNCRISMVLGDCGISERSFSENPVTMVYQKSKTLNQTWDVQNRARYLYELTYDSTGVCVKFANHRNRGHLEFEKHEEER